MSKKIAAVLIAFALLLQTAPNLIAESLNLTTFYPSPAGVFKELRSTDKTLLSITTGDVGIGTASPTAKLDVRQAAIAVGDIVNVFDGGTEVFTILDGGNVGIGSPTPINKLDIAGNANITGNFSLTGNVGIGTSSPAAKLHVYGDAFFRTSTSNGGLYINQEAGNVLLLGYNDGSSSSSNIRLRFNKTTFEAGTVGIGTANPGSLLDVRGQISTSGGSAAAPAFSFVGDLNNGMYSALADNLYLATAGTERLRIDSGGLVGIGGAPQPTLATMFVNNILSSGFSGAGWFNSSDAYSIYSTVSGAGSRYGIYSNATASGGNNWAIYGNATGSAGGAGNNRGVAGMVNNYGGQTGYGGTFQASQIAGNGTKYGVRGEASGGALSMNYGGWFSANGGLADYGLWVDAGNARINCDGDWVDSNLDDTLPYSGTGYQYTTACADIAEIYEAGEKLEPGDVAVWQPGAERKVFKSKTPYEAGIAGVYSTSPGVLMGNQDTNGNPGVEIGNANTALTIKQMGAKLMPLALAGRVPVKINLEGGPIKTGDFLTSSSMPGIAMKAAKSGRVLGMAMENFDGAKEKTGKIQAFINPHWWEGEQKLDEKFVILREEFNNQLTKLRQENETFKLRLDKLEQRIGRAADGR